MELKQARRFNFRCALLAMVVTQGLVFTLELSLAANVAVYILNLVFWVILGAVMEGVLHFVYRVDPGQA